MDTWQTVIAFLLAGMVTYHLPRRVLISIFLAWLGAVIFIVLFTWLDLDKIAAIFGSIAALAALYGIPFLMRDQIAAHPPVRALMRSLSAHSAAEVRLAIIGTAIALTAVLMGAVVIDGAMQVFSAAELVLDDGEPS
jgi:hypothetical protein